MNAANNTFKKFLLFVSKQTKSNSYKEMMNPNLQCVYRSTMAVNTTTNHHPIPHTITMTSNTGSGNSERRNGSANQIFAYYQANNNNSIETTKNLLIRGGRKRTDILQQQPSEYLLFL